MCPASHCVPLARRSLFFTVALGGALLSSLAAACGGAPSTDTAVVEVAGNDEARVAPSPQAPPAQAPAPEQAPSAQAPAPTGDSAPGTATPPSEPAGAASPSEGANSAPEDSPPVSVGPPRRRKGEAPRPYTKKPPPPRPPRTRYKPSVRDREDGDPATVWIQTPRKEIKGTLNPSTVSCSSDEDCGRACGCHPKSCISAAESRACESLVCTHKCVANTMSCGGGCLCLEGRCTAVLVERP